MSRLGGLVAALLFASVATGAQAGVSGAIKPCAAAGGGCVEIAQLSLTPPAGLSGSLFIAIAPMQGGQALLGTGAYFDGRQWKIGQPVAAFTGAIPRRAVAIKVPGGVCGLVRQLDGEAGRYGLVAGWGRPRSSGLSGADRAEIEAMIRTSEPETAQTLQRLLGEMGQVEASLKGALTGPVAAFADMTTSGTYWTIDSRDCGGR